MKKLAERRQYITIQESPMVMLVPQIRATNGFQSVAPLAECAALRLPWQVQKRDGRYYQTVERIAKELERWVENASVNEMIPMPPCSPVIPENPDDHLYRTIKEKGIRPPGDALRLVMMAAAGKLEILWAQVDEK